MRTPISPIKAKETTVDSTTKEKDGDSSDNLQLGAG